MANEAPYVKHSNVYAMVLNNSCFLPLHCMSKAAETLVPNLRWETKQILYAHNFSWILGGSCDSEVPFITAMGQETKTFQSL